jgi:hypothetical protein
VFESARRALLAAGAVVVAEFRDGMGDVPLHQLHDFRVFPSEIRLLPQVRQELDDLLHTAIILVWYYFSDPATGLARFYQVVTHEQ